MGGDEQPGVVIDQVQDLDLGAVGQVPEGKVALPELIGESASNRLKAAWGRLWVGG